MATSSEPCVKENELSIKLSGDYQDVQIAEEELEETESDDDDNSSGPNAVSTLPQGFLKPGGQPSFGNVQVKDSENVHFGDNIKGDNIVFNFKGPVVIKQVVQSKEQDNPAYEQTEDDAPSKNNNQQKPETSEAQIKTSNLSLWLKLSVSAVCIVVVAGICAIVSVTLTYTSQETNSPANDEQDTSTECVSVVGFPSNVHLRLFIISTLCVVLIYIWAGNLLTSKNGDLSTVSVTPKRARAKKNNSYDVEADPLLIAPTHLRIVPRTEWLAQPVEKPLDKIRLPVPWVIIQHTATESCYSQSECILSVRLIQMFHVESRGWFDIGYNFLVAGDGSAYFGRGWEYQGAHTLGYNRYSMGIAFIGTFNNEPPPKKQLDACKKLIQRGVELGKIAKDYKLFAHRQLASTLSPGDKLFDILKEWPHFVKNVTDIEQLLPGY